MAHHFRRNSHLQSNKTSSRDKKGYFQKEESTLSKPKKRTVGSRLLEGYVTHASDGVRKRTDGVIRAGARIAHKLHGEAVQKKGEEFKKGIKKRIAKRF
jgi:hypothetical protein